MPTVDDLRFWAIALVIVLALAVLLGLLVEFG